MSPCLLPYARNSLLGSDGRLLAACRSLRPRPCLITLTPPLPTQIPTSYEAAHAEIAAEAPGAAYYYLAFIATAPAARGRGLAGGLLRHMTARADDEGRLCLLEATRCADVLCTCRGHIVIARGGGW